jgi:hypothetical protein
MRSSPRTWSISATASGRGRRRGRWMPARRSAPSSPAASSTASSRRSCRSSPTTAKAMPRRAAAHGHGRSAAARGRRRAPRAGQRHPEGEKPLAGRSAEDPLSTIVAKGCTQRSSRRTWSSCAAPARTAKPVDEPLATVSAQGTHIAEVRAFLLKYYGNESEGHDPKSRSARSRPRTASAWSR